ncbi:23S rRNA (pseudouridine(1915)-N(3))-methyltransferase RlmH [Romeria aff. gracilis LEGE 07310]|uniref:Ribosomal RNA large subunit methyltransferase H n=1 Tax=Vasconcelosia minhoensis LEGE 07310 TaxID=915328 RepID=A0A8J7A925_9CYAN|nr:23S rRNA (pseudouridine(1915)-N(3))-methyltransferase RlmH [Romeria gracilis]MBE9078310.1 23S rRNA (pseudouridine(1915)-N(3))-methyltransferase RlmH [Romeria aff. gracilis LEGE 07310]
MAQSFPKVKIIAVGKVKKAWLRSGIAVYTQRLPEVEIVEIKDADPEREAAKLQSLLQAQDMLILMAEEGQSFNSIQLAKWLGQQASGRLTFFIGGPAGISPSLKQQTRQQISLSAMTFPHELARLMLLEQLYRAKTILQGSRYHK